MGVIELLLLAVGLSMDAFAVAVCKGLAMERLSARHMVIVGAWFGGFQALMPAAGYLLGTTFQQYIQSIDHWIAFGLLSFIGANMIHESFGEAERENASLHWKTMLVMAVATSIDALAVGVTFAFLEVAVVPAVLTIGAVTFALSALGVKIGSVFGTKYRAKAERAGGIILILLGLKILLEHLGVLRF